jgi:hypothetical protein
MIAVMMVELMSCCHCWWWGGVVDVAIAIDVVAAAADSTSCGSKWNAVGSALFHLRAAANTRVEQGPLALVTVPLTRARLYVVERFKVVFKHESCCRHQHQYSHKSKYQHKIYSETNFYHQ